MPSRSDIVEAARMYLDCPWRHQGRSEQGIDCAGVIVCALRDVGLPAPDRTDYQRRTAGTRFIKHFEKHGIRISVGEMRPGDVAVFREPAFPCHTALVSEKNGQRHMIHGHLRRRKVVEELFDGYWEQYLIAVFRVPGLEED